MKTISIDIDESLLGQLDQEALTEGLIAAQAAALHEPPESDDRDDW